MRIVYAGTPEFAVAPLKAILEQGYNVVGVITQADKPQGRKGVLTPPPVKQFALERGLNVLQPNKLRDELDKVRALHADLLITCAYGQILTQETLDLFEKGVWNIHAGLLPQYRGASPIQSCILAGETETGVCVMKTELGLDSGDILLVKKTEIKETETYGELSERLSELGARAIAEALNALKTGEYALTPQAKQGVNVVKKINKEHAKIDFTKTAQEIVNLVRAMNPAPVAFGEIGENKINVYCAEKATIFEEERNAVCGEIVSESPKRGLIVKCKDGAVKLAQVQASGGKRMSGGDFLNGRKVQKGQVFLC